MKWLNKLTCWLHGHSFINPDYDKGTTYCTVCEKIICLTTEKPVKERYNENSTNR